MSLTKYTLAGGFPSTQRKYCLQNIRKVVVRLQFSVHMTSNNELNTGVGQQGDEINDAVRGGSRNLRKGACPPLPFPPIPFPPLLTSSSRPLLVRPKTNLVYSRAVRKSLVAIILSILKCMFYSRTIKI